MNKTQKAMAATDEAVPAPVEDKAAAYRPNTPKEDKVTARNPKVTKDEPWATGEEVEEGYPTTFLSKSPTGGVQKFFNRQDVQRMQEFEKNFSAFLTALNDIELLLTNRLSEVQDMQKTLKVFQR